MKDTFIQLSINKVDYCTYEPAWGKDPCKEYKTIGNFCGWCKYKKLLDIPNLIETKGRERERVSEPCNTIVHGILNGEEGE